MAEADSATLSLAIVVVFCIYNIILGASMLWLLRLAFIDLHFIQNFFKNVFILPLLVFLVIVSVIPYGVAPLLLALFPTFEVTARTYELTQLAGTMLHLEFVAILLFLLVHGFRFAREFKDTGTKLINFFEMSPETFIKLLSVGVLVALLLVVDVTLHPEVFKGGMSDFALYTGLAVIALLFAALELGFRVSPSYDRTKA